MRKEYEASGKTVDAAIDTACLMAGTTIENVEIEILELGGKGFFGFGHKDARVRIIVELPDAPPEKPARESTFGTKKSKRERFEEKTKKQEDIQIKPIITAQPVAQGGKKQPRPERSGEEQSARPPREREKRERDRGPRPARTEQEEAAPRSQQESKLAHRESHAAEIREGEMEEKILAACLDFLKPIFVYMQVEPGISHELREGILWITLSGANLGLLIGRRGETLNSLQYLTNLAANKHRHDHVRIVLDVEGYRKSREETLATLAHKMADKAVKSGRRVELEPMNPHERRVVHIALQNDRRVDTSSYGEEPYRRVVISKKRGDRKPRQNRENRGARSPSETKGEKPEEKKS